MPVEPTVATPGLLLLHTPPVVASLSVVVEPTHKPLAPKIGSGAAVEDKVTAPAIVLTQPVDKFSAVAV
jgi:hypothetical protein